MSPWLTSSIMWLAQTETDKGSSWYDIVAGVLAIPTATLGLVALFKGGRTTRLANEKAELEIQKLRQELSSSQEHDDLSTFEAKALHQGLGARETVLNIENLIVQFLFLFIALQFWAFLGSFLTEGIRFSLGVASFNPGFVYNSFVDYALSLMYRCGQLAILVIWGLPLMRSVGRVSGGLSLRSLLAAKRER
jgi:hypothetical protein